MAGKEVKVVVSLDPTSKHLLERIAKALERNQNTTIIIQNPEVPQEEQQS